MIMAVLALKPWVQLRPLLRLGSLLLELYECGICAPILSMRFSSSCVFEASGANFVQLVTAICTGQPRIFTAKNMAQEHISARLYVSRCVHVREAVVVPC
jgi:hypothetical protein